VTSCQVSDDHPSASPGAYKVVLSRFAHDCCLASTKIGVLFARRVVEKAHGYPILYLACGGGRYSVLLALPGAEVIVLDKQLGPFEREQRRNGGRFSQLMISTLQMDISAEAFSASVSCCSSSEGWAHLTPMLVG